MRAAAGLACVLSGARFLCRPVRKNNHLQCACSIWVWLLSYDWFILILFFIIIDHRLGRDGRNWYKDSVYPTSNGTHPYDVITLGGVRGPSSRLKKKWLTETSPDVTCACCKRRIWTALSLEPSCRIFTTRQKEESMLGFRRCWRNGDL